ncbi:hypothetical protein D1AOALGA4SA_5499 [Olavius algarvensis Delta 1 endosymbiont]|nr:hypothetical protein D1AOALGA4SA_5499 [Olavius algarvensis Delta 1 endosymbiont]
MNPEPHNLGYCLLFAFWCLEFSIEWTHKRKNSHYISMIR